ncbi:MAG: DUF1540 domain-containing protein [Bacilli bacterium]
MKNSENKNIKCTVHDCEHCECGNDECCLKQIKICNCDIVNQKESTMCNNYKKRSDIS